MLYECRHDKWVVQNTTEVDVIFAYQYVYEGAHTSVIASVVEIWCHTAYIGQAAQTSGSFPYKHDSWKL